MRRPQRWDTPFGPEMTDALVERVLATSLFRSIDPERFPPSLSLADIIAHDARIRSFLRGDIVMREGDYGNSAFVVLQGSAAVLLDRETPEPLSPARSVARRSLYGALSQLWRNPSQPEVRDVATYQGGAALRLRGAHSEEPRTYIEDLDGFLAASEIAEISEGQMFGEIAALSRTSRTATVFALTDCELLEIRWQGLREIRRRDAGFREYIDKLYRSRSLKNHLAESPLLRHLDDETLELIAAQTAFETHGEFEWFGAFKRQLGVGGASSVIEQEPLIAEEGHYVDGLIMIRSGFARVSERLGYGHRTVRYATNNDVFGFDELADHWRHGSELLLRHSLHAIGYVDILRVPTALVERYILPNTPAHLLPPPGRGRTAGGTALPVAQPLIDFLVDNRVINGSATMLINTNRCIGCDECVRACAIAHENNPRFVRHGPEHGNVMVANACMHCQDAVCLIGCPTGAIHRRPEDGRVVIDDATCIGCGTCANSCPYNNIRLVEIRDAWGAFILDEETRAPIVKATKCDLCMGQLGGPACQRACPHDALIRIDMSDQAALGRWINR